MSRIRGRNTSPERLLRQALGAQGHRYRLHSRTPVLAVNFRLDALATTSVSCSSFPFNTIHDSWLALNTKLQGGGVSAHVGREDKTRCATSKNRWIVPCTTAPQAAPGDRALDRATR
jgi:hypothetical protein